MNAPKKILIADDSSSIRTMLREAFQANGYEVVEAVDGIDCIKQVFMHWPSFIILDVKMPKMSGYQACRFLKNNPKTVSIPVMLLTAMDQPIDELWGYETGADLYRSKSSQVSELINEVDSEISKITVIQPKGQLEITDSDILGFLNDILDSKLFELTLINEIASLSHKMDDMNELVGKCAGFLFKMLQFYEIGFALAVEEKAKVYLWSAYEYGPHSDEFKEYIKGVMRSEGYSDVEFVYNFGTQHLPKEFYEKKEFIYVNALDEQNMARHLISGGVFFAFNSDSVDALQRIRFLLNHVLLVISNSMLYQKVVDLSTIDDLTKLYNRRKILEILKTELERSERYDYLLSVIITDIDHFKSVNDAYGHKTGDIVLKKVAMVLKNSLRKVDCVGRFGGEEFLIVSPETSVENAILLAERVRRIFDNIKIEGMKEKVTLSFGVSSFAKGKTIDELINEADMALYDAKRGGRNVVRSFGIKK